jgi:hypothetical protein
MNQKNYWALFVTAGSTFVNAHLHCVLSSEVNMSPNLDLEEILRYMLLQYFTSLFYINSLVESSQIMRAFHRVMLF